MNPLFGAALELQAVCEAAGWNESLIFTELEPFLKLKDDRESARRLRELLERSRA